MGIDRTNYNSVWFDLHDPPEDYGFDSFILKEKKGSRKTIKKALSDAIIFHHTPDGTFKKIEKSLEKLEYKKIASRISTYLPKPDKVKKGNFGEVISADYLWQVKGYEMPIFKLKYSHNKDMPTRGQDIVSFQIKDNLINLICIAEAKYSKEYKSGKIREAHQQLHLYDVKPSSLNIIEQILFDKGKISLSYQVAELNGELGLKDFPRHNWIFILTGDLHKDPFATLENVTDVIDNLTVVNIYLPHINEFMDEIYRMCVGN